MFTPIQYAIGIFVDWKTLAIVNAAICLVYVPIGLFVPESPTWHLSRGNEELARKGLMFLRGPKGNIHQEISEIKKLLESSSESASRFIEIFHWDYLKATMLLNIFIILRQWSGVFAIVAYTVDIFEEAGGAVSAEASSVIVGCVQFVFVLLASSLTDRIGRKKLMVGSALTMAFSHGVFGLYYYLHAHPEYNATVEKLTWVPLVALALFMVGFSSGFASAFHVLMSELIPQKIKNHASSVAAITNGLANFGVLELYYYMKNGLTAAGSFWLYGGTCLTAAFYVGLVLPETKGMSLQELDEEMTKSKRRSQANIFYLEKADDVETSPDVEK
jgi:hypothetical protein